MKRALLLAALLLGAGSEALALSGLGGWVGWMAGDSGCLAGLTLHDLVVKEDTLEIEASCRLPADGIG